MDRSGLRTEAERRLWDAFPRGEMVDLGPGDPTAEGFDPDTWGEDRCVRGEVITRLLLGACERQPGYVARIDLAGARITGEINLSGGQTEHELHLHRCWVDEPTTFTHASSKTVIFDKTRLPGLVGTGWQVSGSVAFADSRCEGETRLVSAHITGILLFSGATLTNPDGTALTADGLTVNGNLVCRDGFTAEGEVRLPGAHITGQLSFNGATLTNPDGTALTADRLTVNGSMFCCEGFTATGKVRLISAHITGQLAFNGATLTNPGGTALTAELLTVGGGMLCGDGFTATGEVGLIGAHIAGILAFKGATLTNPGQRALDLRDVECPHLFLPTRTDGQCDLRRARLGTLRLPIPPEQPAMRLAGLTYTDLDPDPDPPVRQRIAWLRRDPDGFHPQPYEQLATYYRSIGHD
ncbi:MAG: hypothetical protein DIU79_12650, partial [Actinobacteria bacterium]